MDTVQSCKFKPGQIITHKQYGYRGLIYDVDIHCLADDDWYLGNHTQPDKEQPWYHVMVDGAEHTTYVAEENIERDESLDPVEHPMVHEYFPKYRSGKYRRKFDA